MAVAKKRTRATTVVDFKGLRPYPDEGGITWQSAIVIFIMSIVASLATASAYAVSYQSEAAVSSAGASTTQDCGESVLCIFEQLGSGIVADFECWDILGDGQCASSSDAQEKGDVS